MIPDSSGGGVGAWRLHNAAPVIGRSLAIVTELVDRNRRRERSIVQHECGHGQQVEGSLSGPTGSNWTPSNGAQQASSAALLVGGGFNVNRLLTMTKNKKVLHKPLFYKKTCSGIFSPIFTRCFCKCDNNKDASLHGRHCGVLPKQFQQLIHWQLKDVETESLLSPALEILSCYQARSH